MYSPIILFCYRRLDTLKICIDSLKSCPESIFTDLIVYSDASSNNIINLEVENVRNYLKTISGFSSITLNFRNKNFGVDCNIIDGIKEVTTTNIKKFIIVEDDLKVSEHFLFIMNKALDAYESNQNILTISAFNYVKIPKDYNFSCYFTRRTNPWGWATWSDKISKVDWDLANKNNFLTNYKEHKEFNFWGSDRTRMLRRTIINEIKAWDIRLDYYLFKNNLYNANLSNNLIINMGFNRKDASNTTGYNRFKVKINKQDYAFINFPYSIVENKIITKRYIRKNSLIQRILTVFYKKLRLP
jgi:hypothetical protein